MTQLTSEHLSVLLVEDDDKLADFTAQYLRAHGMTVTQLSSGGRVLIEALRLRPDVVLLDLMLPELSGLEVCRQLRRHLSTPIIMVTARRDEADRVMGLEGGADDYVLKPFSSRELVARIRAQARRASGTVGPVGSVIQVGPLRVDRSRMHAELGDKALQLTTHEFELLRAFAEHPGRVLTRDQLLELVSGSLEEALDRSVDGHVSRLRQKLEEDPRRPKLLKTIRGAGYMLSVDGEA